MLAELLRRWAETNGGQPAFISGERVVTYAEAHERAVRVARGIRAEGLDRFGSVVDDPADVPVVVAGASAVGVEACLYPRNLSDEDVARFAARFGHTAVITDGARPIDGVRTIALDDLGRDGTETPQQPADNPVLILTTGTTGDQKGARHDWARLALAVRRPDPEPGRRWLLAYNLNQFAGLQILLHVLVSGGTLVAGTSNRPADALPAMREHRVTHASATPTFWRLLTANLAADHGLALEQITLGGEAAPADLIERLKHLFPDARLSHVYAGTEFGSAVSVQDGLAGLPASVLDRDPDSPVQLRIHDGELQVRSRVGMLGYHEGDDADERWHATGDLVEVQDDRIVFVGRATEVINVGGAKVHPLPIEELVNGVDGVRMSAAYGRPNPVTGQIVAVDVVPDPDADQDDLKQRIRAACEALPRAGRPRRIRFVDALETRGDKLTRGGGAEE